VLGLTATTSVTAQADVSQDLNAVASTSPDIIFGASGGYEVDTLQAKVGAPLARHTYGQMTGKVPAGRLVNMATNVPWRTVAAAKPGSTVYANIARWADTLKSRSGMTMFIFSHEPEGSSSDGLGTASEFIAAFRRVHTIFEARGVSNVQYTWNMTGHSFGVSSSDPRYASKWYPGDAYVDLVGASEYNWYTCGEGQGRWLSLASIAKESLAFARAHGKKLVLAEWGSHVDSRRAAWLRDAATWFRANKSSIRAAFYYQTPNPRPGCSWKLTTSADISAFADMARDSSNFGT
jgi:hypothetical protein